MEDQRIAPYSQSNMDQSLLAHLFQDCEIAKVESRAVTHKPAITFNQSHVYVNAIFLKHAPELVNVLFLINRVTKGLILYPCDGRERDAVRLCTMNETATKPRHIRADEFNGRLFEFMNWSVNYRYKAVGSVFCERNETLAVFDLTAAERFDAPNQGEIIRRQHIEYYSQQSGSFGTVVKHHLENPFIDHFVDDAVVSLEQDQGVGTEQEK